MLQSLNNDNLTILVVDDDAAIRGMLSFILEQAGYAVVEASSSSEAILCLEKDSCQILVLDMGMPPSEHDAQEGVKVLDYISQNHLNIKTLVLTGQSEQEASYMAIRHGAFDFLSKPVSSEILLQAVQRAGLFWSQANKLKEREGIQKFDLNLSASDGVKTARNMAEKKLLQQVLKDTGFNIHEAARVLNIKRENVYYLIKKYNLDPASARAYRVQDIDL